MISLLDSPLYENNLIVDSTKVALSAGNEKAQYLKSNPP